MDLRHLAKRSGPKHSSNSGEHAAEATRARGRRYRV